MEVMMSRYILESEKDSSLFKKFGNGWFPNIDKYRIFLRKQERNNNSFAKTINRYHLVKSSDHIIETVGSKDLESVSSFLEKDATFIESGYGTIKCSSIIPDNLVYPSCYISNGIYHDTEKLALRMVGYGSFVVGVCDNPSSMFYQENMKRIEELKKILNKKHVNYKTYRHNNHRDKTLILCYRSDK